MVSLFGIALSVTYVSVNAITSSGESFLNFSKSVINSLKKGESSNQQNLLLHILLVGYVFHTSVLIVLFNISSRWKYASGFYQLIQVFHFVPTRINVCSMIVCATFCNTKEPIVIIVPKQSFVPLPNSHCQVGFHHFYHHSTSADMGGGGVLQIYFRSLSSITICLVFQLSFIRAGGFFTNCIWITWIPCKVKYNISNWGHASTAINACFKVKTFRPYKTLVIFLKCNWKVIPNLFDHCLF